MSAKLFAKKTQVRCMGPNPLPGATFGFPTFTTLKGGIVAMMRESKRNPEDGKMVADPHGRPQFIVTAKLKVGRAKKDMVTRFIYTIDHERVDEFLAQFVEGVPYIISFQGYPKLNSDGSYYISLKNHVAIANMVHEDVVVKPATTRKVQTKDATRPASFASSEEMQPVIRAAAGETRD